MLRVQSCRPSGQKFWPTTPLPPAPRASERGKGARAAAGLSSWRGMAFTASFTRAGRELMTDGPMQATAEKQWQSAQASSRLSEIAEFTGSSSMRRWLLAPGLVSLFVCLLTALGQEQASPSTTHQVALNGHTFTLPVGFEIELAAGPPLVNRPITADFDEQGRLYVSDSSGSNEKVEIQLQKKPHRIVRLEDTKGNGKFDKSIV